MTELLHLGALVPAAVGACCTVGGRRGPVDLVAAILMLAAMLDLGTGTAIVHPFLWAIVLTVLAVGSALRLRLGTATVAHRDDESGRALANHRAGMMIHTAAGLLIMAALVCAMAGHGPGGPYAGTGMHLGNHHGGSVDASAALIALAVACFIALSVRVAVTAMRRRERLAAVEVVSMTASVVAMGLAAAV